MLGQMGFRETPLTSLWRQTVHTGLSSHSNNTPPDAAATLVTPPTAHARLPPALIPLPSFVFRGGP